jgi:hypothetical protein
LLISLFVFSTEQKRQQAGKKDRQISQKAEHTVDFQSEIDVTPKKPITIKVQPVI